jgi:ankyrin repeat protein
MGCCSSAGLKDGSKITEESIKRIIDRNNPKKFEAFDDLFNVNSGLRKFIDSPFTQFLGVELNPLGYALMKNKFNSFKKLVELGASIEVLEENLKQNSKTILEVVCYNGYADFFKFFLNNIDHIYKQSVLNTTDMTLSIDFDASAMYKYSCLTSNTMPIHLSIDQGHLHIIDIAYNYQKTSGKVPQILDIHHIFERTGENCALIACRKGQFAIVKYLWETTRADFTIQNKNKENALILTAAGSKKTPGGDYMEIFIYLVEEVKLDYRDCYEEILLLLEDKSILSYFSRLLKKTGIHKKKDEVEETFKPKPISRSQPYDPNLASGKFEVQTLISRPDKSESVLSEITPEPRNSSIFSYFFSSFFSTSEPESK